MSDNQKPKHPLYVALEELDLSLNMITYHEETLNQARQEVESKKVALTHELVELTEQELARLLGSRIELMDHCISIDEEDLSITTTPLEPRISFFSLEHGIPNEKTQVEF